MEFDQVVQVVETALVTGPAAATKDQASAAMTGAVGSLRDVGRRVFGHDPVAQQAVQKLQEGASPPETLVWRGQLGEQLALLAEEDLRELVAQSQAVLAQTDPAGTARGRYSVSFELPDAKGATAGIGSLETQHHTSISLPREVTWPLPQLGPLPCLASAFQARPGVRERVAAAQARGAGVVLSGAGGEGKSQLAASYAHQALGDGADLVLWVAAVEVSSIIAAYADAAAWVGVVPEQGSGDPRADARAFTDWLAVTGKTWLVVLDDIADTEAFGSWWPASDTGTGQVLGTTRQHGAVVSGAGRVPVDVGVYLQEESRDYLSKRLTSHGYGGLIDERVDDLTAALAYLPLALSHAAAYMIDQKVHCAEFLTQFVAERGRLDELMPSSADTDTYARAISTTLGLSIRAANAAAPVGLAVPAARLAAVLDPAGHPDSIWASEAVRNYLTANGAIPDPDERQRLDPEPDTQADLEDEPVTYLQTRAAMLMLDRYGLLKHEGQDSEKKTRSSAAARAVRMHGLTQRAIIDTLDQETLADAVWAAADALLSVWPSVDVHADAEMSASLRSNAGMLAHGPGADALWQPHAHRLLYRAGESFDAAGLVDSAISYWTARQGDAERLLGAEHPDTLKIRGTLAASYRSAGRTPEAIVLLEQVAADNERLLGAEHPDTLAARAKLGTSYQEAGRTAEAIGLLELVAADLERTLSAEHPHTLQARNDLARSYWSAGRAAEAIELMERVVADLERLVGPEHTATLTARASLAVTYVLAGRTVEAIELQEQVAADLERLLGAEHPDTLIARAKLASCYDSAGRTSDAIGLMKQVAADLEQVLGAEHPATQSVRSSLQEWTAL